MATSTPKRSSSLLILAGAAVLLALEICLLQRGGSEVLLWALLILSAIWLGLFARRIWVLDAESQLQQRLAEITRQLASLRIEADFWDHLMEDIAILIPHADKCVVHLLDESGHRLYPRYTSVSAPDRPMEPAAGMPADQGLAGRALRERRAISASDVRREPSFLPLHSGSELRSLLVAPFFVAEQPLGTLSLNSHLLGAFSERDFHIVSTLASVMSPFLYRIRLLSQGERVNRHLTAMADLIDDALALVDGKNQIVHHNTAFTQILGLAGGDLVGLALDAPPQTEPSARLRDLMGDLSLPVENRAERLVIIQDPVQAHLRVTRTPVIDEGSSSRLQLITMHDETSSAERLLAHTDIAAAAGRELWALQQQLQEACEGAAPEQARAAARALAMARRLAADLADPCLPEAHSACLQKEPVDLSVLLLELYRRHGQGVDLSSGALRIHRIDDLPLVMADPERLLRAFLGLLHNITHRARPESVAELSVQLEGAEISMTLLDNGLPIPREERRRILHGSFRLQDASPADPAGTGLELWVCKRIVEAHGGQMWMPEKADGGACFRVLLPLERAP